MGYVVPDGAYRSLIRHVGLRPSMSVSDGSPIRHVVLQRGMSISDGLLMKHVEVYNGSPIRHVRLQLVSNGSPIGLR